MAYLNRITGEVESEDMVPNRIGVTPTRAVRAYLKLLRTDTDGTVEGAVWYDDSEDKIKFKTAAGVSTVTSS